MCKIKINAKAIKNIPNGLFVFLINAKRKPGYEIKTAIRTAHFSMNVFSNI